jgi:hypothetical protein
MKRMRVHVAVENLQQSIGSCITMNTVQSAKCQLKRVTPTNNPNQKE